MIEFFNALPSLFEVWRDGKKLSEPVHFFMNLYEGDELHVLQAKDSSLIAKNQEIFVVVTYGNSYETVTYEKSPYTIEKRDTTLSLFDNIGIRTKTWLITSL